MILLPATENYGKDQTVASFNLFFYLHYEVDFTQICLVHSYFYVETLNH